MRQIIEVDEDLCNGCGQCIPNCPEGALQIIDGKARLVSDLFCDGLGACIGHCPTGAMTTVERQAEAYDERRVMQNIITAGPNTIKAHLEHLRDHNETEFLRIAVTVLDEKGIDNPLENTEPVREFSGCPGSAVRDLSKSDNSKNVENNNSEQISTLTQWPIQLALLPPHAPFFNDADLLVMADCVAAAFPNLHSQMIKGKAIAMTCPKLDEYDIYYDRLKGIIEMNNLSSITVAIMEVPCCGGLYSVVDQILEETGKRITLKKKVIKINGTLL